MASLRWVNNNGSCWLIWRFNSNWFMICKVKLFRLAVDMLMIQLLSIFYPNWFNWDIMYVSDEFNCKVRFIINMWVPIYFLVWFYACIDLINMFELIYKVFWIQLIWLWFSVIELFLKKWFGVYKHVNCNVWLYEFIVGWF